MSSNLIPQKGPLTDGFPSWGKYADDGFVFGIDGCPGGWIVAALDVARVYALELAVFEDFAAILNHESNLNARAIAIMIDIPIGLRDHGRRACEQLARKRIGRRASSVFAVPRRPMLAHPDYQTANQWGKAQGHEGGGGLSKQAWGILPKIREVDQFINPADQGRIGESHPEVAFTRLNQGEPCTHPKKKIDDQNERAAILSVYGITDALEVIKAFKARSKARFAIDDALDAMAMALTAHARLKGEAWHLTDGMRDARGLRMEIWG